MNHLEGKVVIVTGSTSGFVCGQVSTVGGYMNSHVPTVSQFRAMAKRT